MSDLTHEPSASTSPPQAGRPPDPPRSAVASFIAAFTDCLHLPRAFWIVIAVFVIETMAYFGSLTLMTVYLGQDLRFSDAWSSPFVSVFTMLVTLFMLGAGSYAESFGLRKALLAAMFLCVGGRLVYALLPGLNGPMVVLTLVMALLIIALGEAILQPVCYSGVKQYTDQRTSSMGYGLIYAFMNAGIVVVGELSARLRPAVQQVIDARRADAGEAVSAPATPLSGVYAWFADRVGSGVQAVNWLCLGIAGIALLTCFLLTRGTVAAKLRPDLAEEMRRKDARPWTQRLASYFAEGPFTNPRFMFFIFMLLPVRTLFAHQWLTMPQYILRAYSADVGNNMERLVNWINPAIIFVGVPIATAMTRRVNVYTMMIIGSFVSAAPTFLLTGGANIYLLISYFVLFSIGEALWSARFLEYASELAPDGRIAQYMGLANVPWLLAKGLTGFYSGRMLQTFCPEGVPREQLQTQALWLIYGCIAMASPIGLLIARRWVMSGMAHPQKS